MVAAGRSIDARRAAELAPHDHGDVTVQAAFFKIRHQGVHSLIQPRQQVRAAR